MAFDYFTLAELRALPEMDDESTYSDATCQLAHDYVVGKIERATGTCFIERTVTAEAHSGGCLGLVLDHADAIAVTAATDDGDAITGYTFLVVAGVAYLTSGGATASWPSGFRNIAVTYTRGYSTTPPGDLKGAALQATRSRLLATAPNAAMDDRRVQINTEVGSFNLALAGPDRPFGIPEVDEVVNGYRQSFGFA